jgi:hypothetical protein
MKTLLFSIIAVGWILVNMQASAGQAAQYRKDETIVGQLITLHDPSGDYFGLKLEGPLDFAPSSDPEMADTEIRQRNVTEVQLVGYTGYFMPLLNELQGVQVSLDGKFIARHTIHHVRPVLFALKGDTIRDTKGFSVSITEEQNSDNSFEKELASYGSSVTYQKKSENWYVISGVNNTQEYYLKVLYSGPDDPALMLLIQYPHEASSQYDKLVSAISKSFER